MLDAEVLKKLYLEENNSMQEIATQLGCSLHKVDYWFRRHSIKRRSRSDATYVKHNRTGDPFKIKTVLSPEEMKLYGMGVGIYWGEGNKKNPHTVRVGNTDPKLIAVFVEFLIKICGVDSNNIRYGLQIFTDTEELVALEYWQNLLNIRRDQIMPTVNKIVSGKIGTYKTKSSYGVLTVYVFNKKLRDWMIAQIGYADIAQG